MAETVSAAASPPRQRWRRLGYWALAVLLVIVLYYGFGSYLFYRIDDDPDFAAAEPIAGGSHMVDMAAALIERETITHSWQANDPWFMPNGMLIHPAAFQVGIQGALARVAFELVDQLGRTRGSSRADPDLERAAGLLGFPPNIWYFDFSKSLLPTITSDQQYRAGRQALLAYNQRLAANNAVFEVRTDALAATLKRIVVDLGSQSAAVDEHLRHAGGFPLDLDADRLFYLVKGRLYGYHMVLRELGRDYQDVITRNNLTGVWTQTLDTMREVGYMRPLFVFDGTPRDGIFANHLAFQGFYLKRAMVQLQEMSQVLVN